MIIERRKFPNGRIVMAPKGSVMSFGGPLSLKEWFVGEALVLSNLGKVQENLRWVMSWKIGICLDDNQRLLARYQHSIHTKQPESCSGLLCHDGHQFGRLDFFHTLISNQLGPAFRVPYFQERRTKMPVLLREFCSRNGCLARIRSGQPNKLLQGWSAYVRKSKREREREREGEGERETRMYSSLCVPKQRYRRATVQNKFLPNVYSVDEKGDGESFRVE